MRHKHHYLDENHDSELLIPIIGVCECPQQDLEEQVEGQREDRCRSAQVAE